MTNAVETKQGSMQDAELKVWAPLATRLDLELAGTRVPMQAAANGWYAWRGPALVHDVDYALWVDGEGPFPDPRAASQPQGVHGPSRRVDHARFRWKTTDFRPVPLRDALIYEVHIGTFTPEGTFAAAIHHLDELRLLGITHVELMPVAEFAGTRGWGYDCVDLFAPHHHYGGPDGLKQLVDACHQRGIAVLFDVVYNHLGPVGNYLGKFGPYFTDIYHTPWGSAVNLDGAGSDEVRRFFIDNALMWLRDYRGDGLRIDAIHAFMDRSAVPFLEQLQCEVQALAGELGRPLVVIAESDLNDTRVIRPREQGGMGLDAQWSDDFHHALHVLLTGETFGYYQDFGALADLAKVLGSAFRYDHCYSSFRRRMHGNSTQGLGGARFVVSLQNHDQIGNRGGGERIGHLVNPDKVKLGAALTLLGPFVPLLFQGEEWAATSPFLYFIDFEDPELRQAVREGRRREFAAFGWDPDTLPDPQAVDTWRRSQLHRAERHAGRHRETFAWYSALIALRREHRDFAAGDLDPEGVAFDAELGWLRFRRGRFVVLCNFAADPRAVPSGGAVQRLVLASQGAAHAEQHLVHLPAHGVAVVECGASPPP